jgi:hypothetical protein
MDTKRCPYCGEEILTAAKKCKHCREWLDKTDEINQEDITSNGFLLKKQDFRLGILVAIGSILISFADVILSADVMDKNQYKLLFWGLLLEISMLFSVKKYLKNFRSDNAGQWMNWLIIFTGCVGILGFFFVGEPEFVDESELIVFFGLMFIIVLFCYIFVLIKTGYVITKIPDDFVGNLKLYGQAIMYCAPIGTIVALIASFSESKAISFFGFIICVIPAICLISIFIKALRFYDNKRYVDAIIVEKKESSNITEIKRAIYGDYTKTLGDALEKYIYFSLFGKTWNESQYQGKTVVEFRAKYSSRFIVKIRFLIHVDWEKDEYGRTFDVEFAGYSEDGHEWESFAGYNGTEIVELIYKNRPLPHLSKKII